MPNRLRYPELAPEGYAALSAFGHYINTATTLSPELLGLVNLRASLLNGCEFCTALHRAELRKLHEPSTRIDAVEDPQGAPDAFTPRERAALAWTELITRLGDNAASDADYVAVSAFFQDKDLIDLTFAIVNINAWNRMGIAFRPKWRPRNEAGGNDSSVTQGSPDNTGSGGDETRSAVDDDGGKVAED